MNGGNGKRLTKRRDKHLVYYRVDATERHPARIEVTSSLLPARIEVTSSFLAQNATSTLYSTPITPAPETSSGDDDSSSSSEDNEELSSDVQEDAISSEEDIGETEDDYAQTNPLREQIRESIGSFI
jgi:hypothetical protein